jgi:hypothetical protein
MPWSAPSTVIPVDLHIAGCPPRSIDLLRGLIALVDVATAKKAGLPLPSVRKGAFRCLAGGNVVAGLRPAQLRTAAANLRSAAKFNKLILAWQKSTKRHRAGCMLAAGMHNRLELVFSGWAGYRPPPMEATK